MEVMKILVDRQIGGLPREANKAKKWMHFNNQKMITLGKKKEIVKQKIYIMLAKQYSLAKR